MTVLVAGDILFYVLALVALGGAVASALRPSLLRSAQSALVSASALALLWARAGASGLAALQLALVVVGAVVLLLAPATMRGDDGDRARLLRAAAMPIAAWLVLVLRVVLMTRWPVENAAAWAVPGLLHHLVLALALLAVSLLSAASRRSVRAAAVAAASAGSAVATALVALSRFTVSGEAAAATTATMAALAVASSWIVAGVAVATAGDEETPVALAPSFTAGLSMAVAGIALALLAGTW